MFDNFTLAEKSFAKDLRGFAICLCTNNNFCWKLILSLPIMFDYSLLVPAVALFVADFNVSSFESDSFTFTLLYCVILYWYYI